MIIIPLIVITHGVVMLSIIRLIVIMQDCVTQNAIAHSVNLLGAIMFSTILLSVIVQNVVAPKLKFGFAG